MSLISSKAKRNLVVGAGFSGAVMAERLASVLCEDVLVIDRASNLAGISYDYRESGINIHKFGTHIFHTNHEFIWRYLNRFSKFDICAHRVSAYAEGQFINIPFNLNSLYKLFPKTMAGRIETKLVKKYGLNSRVPFFEFKTKFFWDKDLDFLASYVYQNIFQNLYKKLKGVSFDALNAFIKDKISVFITKDDRFYKSKYQGVPSFGYTKLIENILNHKNIRLLLNTDFKTVDIESFDRVFYTGSIDEFFNFKYGMLNYRSAVFEIEELNLKQYQDTGVVCYPNDYDFIKIHEFKHYETPHSPRSEVMRGALNVHREPDCAKTIIAKEYLTDFTPGKNERLYPVLDERNLKIFNKYKDEAKRAGNVYFFGRLGDFKYYSMDSAVKRALELFDSIKFREAIDFCKEQKPQMTANRP